MMQDEKMYHIGLNSDMTENAVYAILPGDPQRVKKIATLLDNPHFIARSREYTSYIGYIKNKPVLVMSTGMGGPSAAIAVEELNMTGIKSVIRVGTCGGMQKDVRAGDIVIAHAAVRHDGTSREYIPVEYPAVADLDLTLALRDSAQRFGFSHHTGIVHCKDSFYGQHSPERMPSGEYLKYKWQAWKMGGVLASEMETSAVFTAASVLKMRAAAALLCVWNQDFPDDENNFDTERAIKTVIEAINTDMERSCKS